MSLPLLAYTPNSQNHRVKGYEVAGDAQPRIYSLETTASNTDIDNVIRAAYGQIFHEQQMLKSNRQTLLESQLRAGLITVKGFIRGLATCSSFHTWNYHPNSNYRFVELCVQRILGRNVYDRKETLAWSILLATNGLEGFIDALLGSDEYGETLGKIPYLTNAVGPCPSDLRENYPLSAPLATPRTISPLCRPSATTSHLTAALAIRTG